MLANILEQIPQLLGAAAAFMLGWACCDWVKSSRTRAEQDTTEPEVESSAGPAQPIGTSIDDVTKVDIVRAVDTPVFEQPLATVVDATTSGQGQQDVAGDGIFGPENDALGLVGPVNGAEEPEACPDVAPELPTNLAQPAGKDSVRRDGSVRVLDTLVTVDEAD